MRRQIVERSGGIRELSGVPLFEYFGIGSRGNEARRGIDVTDGLAEFERTRGELIACRIAEVPVAPQLVAEFPQQPGLLGPVLVNVADPLGGFLGVPPPIESDLRLRTDEAAEFQEFVGPERVVLGTPRSC